MTTGENGRGLASRWYPSTLARRIRAIAQARNRIAFEEGDGLQALAAHGPCEDTACFIDPPYTVAGRRLYNFLDISHDGMFHIVAGGKADFLMTYDDAPAIRRLAAARRFEIGLIPMKSTHHAKMMELLIGSTGNRRSPRF
jgi:DNA adenine methylase